jgi:hypothetical protein
MTGYGASNARWRDCRGGRRQPCDLCIEAGRRGGAYCQGGEERELQNGRRLTQPDFSAGLHVGGWRHFGLEEAVFEGEAISLRVYHGLKRTRASNNRRPSLIPSQFRAGQPDILRPAQLTIQPYPELRGLFELDHDLTTP